jgi:dTDP-4-dehydrorhamnose reductase
MTHFLVTGASGLLGLNFCLAVDGKKHKVTGVDYRNPLKWVNFKIQQANLTKSGSIDRIINEVRPDVILHCAANANVDDCENHPDEAEAVNSVLPGEIAEAASRHKIRMIHISTDAVFDGEVGNYTENDMPNPLNVYSLTKLRGENAVLTVNPQALVLRVNFYGWSISGKRSLAEFFVNNLAEKKPVMGFTDVVFCPMMVLDLVDTILEANEKGLNGLFHCVGPEKMSKYEFGVAIANQFEFDSALISPAAIQDGGLTAARSPNLTLSTEKLTAALGHPLPAFLPGLKKFQSQYRHGFPEMIKTLVE